MGGFVCAVKTTKPTKSVEKRVCRAGDQLPGKRSTENLSAAVQREAAARGDRKATAELLPGTT